MKLRQNQRFISNRFTVCNLYGTSDFNPTDGGRIQRIYLLATIGVIVVVIACVNFTNLATARAVTRKREVGVAKGGRGAKAATDGSVFGRIPAIDRHRAADCPGVCQMYFCPYSTSLYTERV